MTRCRRPIVLLTTALLLIACQGAGLAATDAPRGPYHRIVTLAPNLAELVFAAGAGDALIAVSAWSDYPPAVKLLPVIGDAFSLDQEKLLLLQPDLLLAWKSGTPARVVDQLRSRGYHVETVQTQSLADIATALETIGGLTDHRESAHAASLAFRHGIDALGAKNRDAEAIRVFYQVSARPLYTINGNHYISELLSLCGGVNVFADLDKLAPSVDVEAVLDRDPEVLMASSDAGDNAFSDWDRWPQLAANRFGNRFLMPADDIGRPTPRVLQAGDAVCRALDKARAARQRAELSP